MEKKKTEFKKWKEIYGANAGKVYYPGANYKTYTQEQWDKEKLEERNCMMCQTYNSCSEKIYGSENVIRGFINICNKFMPIIKEPEEGKKNFIILWDREIGEHGYLKFNPDIYLSKTENDMKKILEENHYYNVNFGSGWTHGISYYNPHIFEIKTTGLDISKIFKDKEVRFQKECEEKAKAKTEKEERSILEKLKKKYSE